MDRLRIGVIGLVHDHVWDNLAHFAETSDVELAAASDANAPLRDRVAQEFQCPVYDSHEKMLDDASLDAVMIFASNADGAEWADRAARRGLHVMIEKPMAESLRSADEMIASARKAKVRLMVNWPFAWWPQLQQALRMAESGAVGDVWQVKYRAAHAGPEELGCSQYFCDWLFDELLNGGGALMDYCCYGANLARVLMGVPSRVSGFVGRFCKDNITVEDNAMLVMTYAHGMATAEGSWTQIGKLTSYTTAVYGTKGTLMVEPRAGGRLFLANHEHPDGQEIDVTAPPEHQRHSLAHFVHGVRTGEDYLPLCQDRVCRDVQEILEAGRESSETGQFCSLPLL